MPLTPPQDPAAVVDDRLFRPAVRGFTWTTAMVARLTALWQAGTSINDIGRILSGEFDVTISRNAAVGKAHRLGLAKRYDPINRGPKKTPPASAPKPGRAALLGGMMPMAMPPSRASGVAAKQKPQPAAPIEVPRRTGLQRRQDTAAMAGCRYPMWGSEQPTGIFCAAPRVDGKPYCATHCAVCYTNWPGFDGVPEAAS